ncbi:MAG: Icc protein [Planctomycetota bacterium]|jgi:Icc protein
MSLRVAQITDTHLTAEPGSKLYGVDTALSLQNIIEQIQQLDKKPELIIASGDVAEDGAIETYQRFCGLLAEVKIPIYLLPGNHDDLSNMQTVFNSAEFLCVDATSIHDWGFIFVNSKVADQSHGHVDATALNELEKNIIKMKDQPILVAIHHTPSRVCPSFGCQLENATEFTELLNRHSNVKGVIAGHTHLAFEENTRQHTQYTTPSTFAKATHAQAGESVDHDDFWASHSLDGSQQGFRILDLHPEGGIHSEVHWL